jgi:tetratricopeptide (TPR) repeat protein
MAKTEQDQLKHADELLDRERWEDAIATLEVLVTTADLDVVDKAWNLLAFAYAAVGRSADSESMIRRSIAQRAETNDALGEQLLSLGVVVRRQGRLDEAERLEAQALDLLRDREPEMTVFILRNLAFLYWTAGQQDRAREIYDRMPECDPDGLALVLKYMKPFAEPDLPKT